MDVDVFAETLGAASDLAGEIDAYMDGARLDEGRAETASTPHERPDYNPNVRRFGLIVDWHYRP